MTPSLKIKRQIYCESRLNRPESVLHASLTRQLSGQKIEHAFNKLLNNYNIHFLYKNATRFFSNDFILLCTLLQISHDT